LWRKQWRYAFGRIREQESGATTATTRDRYYGVIRWGLADTGQSSDGSTIATVAATAHSHSTCGLLGGARSIRSWIGCRKSVSTSASTAVRK
jgi:hypothetical protein